MDQEKVQSQSPETPAPVGRLKRAREAYLMKKEAEDRKLALKIVQNIEKEMCGGETIINIPLVCVLEDVYEDMDANSKQLKRAFDLVHQDHPSVTLTINPADVVATVDRYSGGRGHRE